MKGTFKGCSSLVTSPEIPSGVTNLESAFEGCSSITVLPTLPNAVTNMKNAFKGCSLVANTSTGITIPGIAIYHGENYDFGDYQQDCNPPTVGEINKDFGSSLANSFSGNDFAHNEYSSSEGYALSDDITIAVSNPDFSWAGNTVREYIVKDSGNNYYLCFAMSYYAPKIGFIPLGNIAVSSDGSITASSVTEVSSGDWDVVYSDSTMETGLSDKFGQWNWSGLWLREDHFDINDTFYINDQYGNMSGTYTVVMNDVILQSTVGINYVKTNPAIVLPGTVTNAEGCFQNCTSITNISKIPSSVTNVKNCFNGCSSLQKIDVFQVSLATLDSASGQDCFKNCSSLAQVGFKVNEADWHLWKLTYGNSTVEGKIYDSDGTSTTIPQTSITKTDLQLPILTDELWFPDETDVEIEAIIQKIFAYRYGVFKKNVLPPDQVSFVLMAEDPNNVISNILTGSKIIINRTQSLTISQDSKAIITASGVTLTLPATGSTTGSILELFTVEPATVEYYTDANTMATLSMIANSKVMFVYQSGWKMIGAYGAVWN